MAMVSAVCIATLESRVLVSARRLRELKAGAEDLEIEVIEPVERVARRFYAPGAIAARQDRWAEEDARGDGGFHGRR